MADEQAEKEGEDQPEGLAKEDGNGKIEHDEFEERNGQDMENREKKENREVNRKWHSGFVGKA